MENSSLLQKSISKKNDLCQEENKLCAIAKTTFINEKKVHFYKIEKMKSMDFSRYKKRNIIF